MEKLQITPNSTRQRDAIEAWAELEGRTISGLAAFLLESALIQAARDGAMPPAIARAFNYMD
jgi:hypothetical protein